LELHVEKLIYGGDGLARLPADERGRGKAVFLPFVLPGEKVEASITDEKPGFAWATVDEILEPSQERTSASCPYFERCGGCHYQHTNYEEQLEIKKAILKENLYRLAKLDLEAEMAVHPSPPWNYRNRTRMQVRTEPEFALGFFKVSSHALLAVEECPISSPLINRALEALWELGRAGHLPSDLREIELFADADDGKLLVELYLDSRRDLAEHLRAAETTAEALKRSLPEVASVYAFAQTINAARGTHGRISEEPDWSYRPGEFQYRTATSSFRVSGGSFFQVNRFLVDELVAIVTSGCAGKLALDLYAGVGLFTVNLAAVFHHTVAVESSQSSAADLKYNCPPNVKAVRSPVDAYLAGKGSRLRPELVLVDPPRAGLGERVAKALVRLHPPRIRYVSCDPATLARDLVHFRTGGYRVEQVHLVDLFPQTYHIESVVELAR
jgi:23S rRNA (uracil1939-C5)-methyltransferase